MATKIQLPFGCSCSVPKIHPANWKTGGTLKQEWYIHYRFYDAKGNWKQKKIRGANDLKTLTDRRRVMSGLLANELDQLQNYAYNPITGKCTLLEEGELNEFTPFIQALGKAKEMLNCSVLVKKQVAQSLEHINTAIFDLKYDRLPIAQVKRKHVRFVLDQVGRNKEAMKLSESKKEDGKVLKGWTASIFNHYRAYLMMLFDQLQELELLEIDLTRIKKQKEIKRLREMLSKEEIRLVKNHLEKKFPEFLRYVHIFYHSGARSSELLRLKKEHVDLKKQRYKLVIMKGRKPAEVWKTIKDVALPYWSEVYKKALPGEYLFSAGLMPGKSQISAWQISKRWHTHVMKPLGIRATFYSLKHLHTTEVAQLLGTNAAAEHNSHRGSGMVIKIYDQGHAEREHKKLKGLKNVL